MPSQNIQDIQGLRKLLRDGLAYVGELIRVIVISLAIILPIRYFLVQPFYVKGASMEPNFYDHEYLIIDEASFRFRDPKRGEIVVFRYPNDPSQFFIKRVIGLPGETLRIQSSRVLIKSKDSKTWATLEEPYLSRSAVTIGDKEVSLGAEEYFVIGDNRTSSLDSRVFGPVLRDYIVGRAWIRGWPLDRVTRFLTPNYEINTGEL